MQTKLIRNLSLKQNTTTAPLPQPSSPKRLPPKPKTNNQSYIAMALANIQTGCIDQKTGLIKIDGDYGDFRMKIFRNKDRMKYYNDPSSLFGDKEFLQKIWDYADCGKTEEKKQVSLLPNIDEPSSPKKNRLQRARIGLQRQNSIMSPILKDADLQKLQKHTHQKPSKLGSQLYASVNDILSKSIDSYLYKPVQNAQEQQEKKLRKGVEQQLRQKQGYLFYRSIPPYMAEKWFKTVDNSTPNGNYVTPYVQEKPIPKTVKKPNHKRTHIFRFLEKNCPFNSNKSAIS